MLLLPIVHYLVLKIMKSLTYNTTLVLLMANSLIGYQATIPSSVEYRR